MDPTLGEKQNDQTQEKKSGGGIGQGINIINNLMGGGVKNPFGKIGSRAVIQTALRGFSAFLTSPVGLPILIAIAAVFILTLIIVGFGGPPFLGPNGQTTSASPTETPTPTPAP